MKLKRVLAVLLALCMILPLAACGDKEEAKTTTAPGKDAPSSVVTTTTEAGTPSSVPGLEPTPSEGETTVTEEGETTVTEEGETTVPEEGETTVPEEGETTVPEEDGTTKPNTDGTTKPNTDGTTKPSQNSSTKVTTTTKGKTTTTTTKSTKSTKSTRTTKTLKPINTVTQKPSGQDNNFGTIVIKEGTTPVEKGLNFGGKTYTFGYYGSGWDEDHSKWHADFQKQYNVKLDIRGIATDKYTAGLSSAMAAGNPYDIIFLYSFDYPAQITANVMAPLNDYITTADLWTEKSATTGGFSKSLLQAHSLNGNLYCVAGNYLQTPTVLWYNKKIFADAGYDGSDDPLALYKKGTFSWDVLYDMLSDIKDEDKGLWGINSIAPYYEHQFINSFDTDVAKLTKDGRLVQNLGDSNLYDALNMLQKYSYGEHKVADPKNQNENGIEAFLNGTTASVINTAGAYWTFYTKMSTQVYTAFGSKEKQLSNLGAVPIPCRNGVHSIWDWMGYGAGNGASKEGILCALAFAKHDSIVNHKQAYHPNMTAEMKNLFCGILNDDNLRGPMDGFKTAAGSLGGICGDLTRSVALKGQNAKVVLKGYEKVAQTVIDQAIKG